MQQVSLLSQVPLLKVCQHLDLPDYKEIEDKEDSTKSLIRKVNRHLLREELEEREDEGMSTYTELRDFLHKIIETDKPPTAEPTVPRPQPDPTLSITSKMSTSPTSLLSLTRREFKISGQIGEPGQRDRLSFSSLAHQIEQGRLKGHTEREIVEGVIRSVMPGCPLRSYLEGRIELTLPKLRHILRSHYHEKDATELYHQLSRLAQENKESAQSFLVRALDLKQKVIFASQETGSGLKYDPNLVQNMFLHALLTGLRSDTVKSELRPYLQKDSTTDEELFEKINLAASQEAERQEKLGNSNGKTVAVKGVMQEEKIQYINQESPSKKKPKEGTLMSDLADIKAGIAEIALMKKQISGLQETLSNPHYNRPQQHTERRSNNPAQRRGCPQCYQSGTGDNCNHCYKCGSGEHYARGCRSRQQNSRSGNGEGLLLRDEQ